MQCDCGEQLIETDRYGERLTGCIQCNRWSSDKSAFSVELSVEDFKALRVQKTKELSEGDPPDQYVLSRPRASGGCCRVKSG
jgi:hypothetical protein